MNSVAFSWSGLGRRFLGTGLLLLALAAPLGAVETAAPRALIIEADTGTLLFAKATDEAFPPGNFAKLVTAAVVFDALAAGEIREDQRFPVTEHAWRTGGAPARVTTMFAAVRSEVPVADLLKGLIVQYGNDSAIVLAEGLAGSELAFAQRMNAFADRIGMDDSRFANPTGFEDSRSRTTLDDLATLVTYIQTRHAAFYGLYGLEGFEWNRINQLNKTTLIRSISGVDGLVQAYDEDAGFGAVVSAVRDGRRVIVAASGLKSDSDRERQIKALTDSAYTEFDKVVLFPADALVTSVRVFGGAATHVAVTGDGPVRLTLPREDREDFRARVVYDGPVRAPVAKGQPVAAFEVRLGEKVVQRVPLVAATDVPVGDLLARARDGLSELLFGWW